MDQTFLKLAEGLEKQLTQSTKAMTAMDSVAKQLNNNLLEQNKSTQSGTVNIGGMSKGMSSLSTETSKAAKLSQGLNKTFSAMKKTISSLGAMFGASMVAMNVKDLIADMQDYSQKLKDLSYQMGENGTTARQMQQDYYDIQKATGYSADAVGEMMIGLRQARIATKDLNELTTTSLQFTEVTGASKDSVKNLTAQLIKMGGMTKKQTTDMMGSILQVQRQFGMTGSSVNALIDNITETTSVLKNMGKTSTDIMKFQKGVVKLAGAFESVGLKASDATQLVDRLLDPGKLEDNALLYAKLGISMEDAINGNIDPDTMTSKLKNLGMELQGMAGPQAAALAQSMGVSLNQIRQMGNMDLSKTSGSLTDITNGAKDVATAVGEQDSGKRRMEKMWNKIKATVSDLAFKLFPLLEKGLSFVSKHAGTFVKALQGAFAKIGEFLPSFDTIIDVFKKIPKYLVIGVIGVVAGLTLLRKKFASFDGDTAKNMGKSFEKLTPSIATSITNGVTAGLEMAAEKTKTIFDAKVGRSIRATHEQTANAIKDSYEYSAQKAKGAYLRGLGDKKIFGFAKKMAESSAKYTDSLAMGVSSINAMDTIYARQNARILERVKMSGVEHQNEININDVKKKAMEEQESTLKTRITILKEANKIEELSPARQIELNKLKSQESKLGTEILEITKKNEKINSKAVKLQQKLIKSLTSDGLAQETKSMIEQRSILEKTLDTKKKLVKSTKEDKDLNDKLLDSVEKRLNKSQQMGRSQKSFSKAQVDEIQKLKQQQRELATTGEQYTDALSSADNELKDINAELKKTDTYMESLNARAKDKGIDINVDSGITNKTGMAKVGDTVKGAFGNARADLIEGGETLKNSFITAGKALWAKNPIKKITDIPKKLKALGSGNIFVGLVKAGGKLAGKIGKSIKEGGAKLKSAIGGSLKNSGKAMAMGGAAMLGAALLKTDEGKELMEGVQKMLGEFVGKFAKKLSSILPAIMNVMESLLPIFMMLVEKLLPPVLKVLSFLITVLGKLISAIGGMIKALGKAFNNEAMVKMGDGIQDFGNTLVDAGKALNRAADIMSGTALAQLGKDELKAKRDKILSENNNNMTKALGKDLGLNTEQMAAMSADQMATSITETGNRTQLINELILNTKNLAMENTRAEAQFIASEITKAATEVAGEKVLEGVGNITKGDWTKLEKNKTETGTDAGAGNYFDKIGNKIHADSTSMDASTGFNVTNHDLVDIKKANFYAKMIKQVQNNDGVISAEMVASYKEMFSNSEYKIDDKWLTDGGIRSFIQDATQKVGDLAATNFEFSAGEYSTMIGKLEANVLKDKGVTAAEIIEQVSSESFNSMLSKNNGNMEKTIMDLTNLLSAEGGAIYEKELKKSTDIRIDGAIKSLKLQKEVASDSDKRLIDEMLQGLAGAKSKGRGTETLAELEKLIESDRTSLILAATELGIVQSNTEGVESASTESPAESAGGVITKLYPAILEATSSGWVQTQDAYQKVSGGTPEEQAVAIAEAGNTILGQMLESLRSLGMSNEQIARVTEAGNLAKVDSAD